MTEATGPTREKALTPDRSQGASPVDELLLSLARVFHWSGLYGPGHPVLAKRIDQALPGLLAKIETEPGHHLLLGIAPDKFLYGDRFVGEGQPMVVHLAESLYLLHVATIDISAVLSAASLETFFRRVQTAKAELRSATATGEASVDSLAVPGIVPSLYNYKDLLARRIVEEDQKGDQPERREERLWKALITADRSGSHDDEEKVVAEMSDYPELLAAILSRVAKTPADASGGALDAAELASEEILVDGEAAPGAAIGGNYAGTGASVPGGAGTGAPGGGGQGGPGIEVDGSVGGHVGSAVAPEVLMRLFRRLGAHMQTLPDDRRQALLASLDNGLDNAEDDDSATAFAEAMTEGCNDERFLDLMGSLLSVEKKGNRRALRAFEAIAIERNRGGALSEKLKEKDSLSTKTYYSVKAWDTIEQLLLSRTEDDYLAGSHARFVEASASGDIQRTWTDDPVLYESVGPEAMMAKTVSVLLSLLAFGTQEEDFVDQLEEVGKMVPNLISNGRIVLLRQVLTEAARLSVEAPESRRDLLRTFLAAVDFGEVIDVYVNKAVPEHEAPGVPGLLAKFAPLAVIPLLDRILTEPVHSKRRVLLSLLTTFGQPAVPWIVERLAHPKWFLVRNMCLVLGDVRAAEAVPGLIRTLSHKDVRVAKEAAGALGKIRAPEAVPALGKLLVEEGIFGAGRDEGLRLAAANALFATGGVEAKSFIHRGAESRRGTVRVHCKKLLDGGRVIKP